MFNPGLKLGEVITNRELMSIFGCGVSSGMRRGKRTNTLVIVSDHTKGLYDDKWEDDILHYTGMGKTGDQDINYKQNKTLNESNKNGVEVFLFEAFEVNKYIYRGQVKLVKEPYTGRQRDIEGNMRNVWMFPVKPINTHKITIDKEVLEKNYKKKQREAEKLSDEELKKRAEEKGSSKPNVRNTTTKSYERDADVAEYAKRRAKGVCQLCKKPAPFKNKKGEPYLETHHVVWLSKGGEDTIANTVALCPNCHRRMHVVNNKSDIKILKHVND